MQKRNIQILFRLNEAEYKKLTEKVEKSGLNRETYIRTVLAGHQLKEQPPVDFFNVIHQLDQINNNLNQIARKANATGHIDAAFYETNVRQFESVAADLMRAIYGNG